jgi:hypothetical protein
MSLARPFGSNNQRTIVRILNESASTDACDRIARLAVNSGHRNLRVGGTSAEIKQKQS